MSLCSILELKMLTQNWLAYWRHGNVILSDFLFYEMAPLHLFIGPRSDHSLPMSLTNWLTNWLTNLLKLDVTTLLKIEWMDPCWLGCPCRICRICRIARIYRICRICRICKKCRICRIREICRICKISKICIKCKTCKIFLFQKILIFLLLRSSYFSFSVLHLINHEVQNPMSPFNLADLFSPRIWSS